MTKNEKDAVLAALAFVLAVAEAVAPGQEVVANFTLEVTKLRRR